MRIVRVSIAVCSMYTLLVTAEAAAQAQGAPVIERVEPTSGPPGTVVNVIGRRFGQGAQIKIGEQSLVIVDHLPNRVSARVPAGAASGLVAVVAAGGTVRGPEFRVTAPPPPPVIDAMEPAKGPPGSQVSLRGKHFSPRLTGNVVTFGGRPVIVRAATPQELRVIVPEVDAGATFTVRVEQAGEVQSPRFELSAATNVTQIEPERAGPGAEIKVRGRGFAAIAANNRVYLNNVPLKVVRASETELVVQLPQSVASGKVLVDVKGAGRAQSATPFVVQRPPRISDFTPKKGPAGTVVTVRGTNFGSDAGAIEVKLGEVRLPVREAHGTRLELTIPEGARDERLTLRVHGVGPAWSDASFTVMAPLAVTNFTPQSGPVNTEIVIEGQGFGDAPARNRVTIAGQVARVVEATPTRLRVRVGKGKSGPLEVQVQGSGSVRTAAPFVITRPPYVTRVTPRKGVPGTELRIEGRGFGKSAAVLKVTIGGQPLSVTSVNDEVATAVLPPGAKSGRLKVTMPLEGSVELDWEFEVVAAAAPAPVPAPVAAPTATPAPTAPAPAPAPTPTPTPTLKTGVAP